MPDWYKDNPHAGPESDEEYYAWAQDNGLYVDAAGNVDYGPPEYDYRWGEQWGDGEGDERWGEQWADPGLY